MTRRTVLIFPLALILPACHPQNIMQKAIDLVPTMKSAVQAIEDLLPGDMTPLKVGLENVKRGIDLFETAGKAYLADPNATNYAATISAVEAFMTSFDTLPNVPAQVRTAFDIARVALHFVEALVAQTQPPAGARSSLARPSHTGHVTQTELRDFAKKHKLEKYLKGQ